MSLIVLVFIATLFLYVLAFNPTPSEVDEYHDICCKDGTTTCETWWRGEDEPFSEEDWDCSEYDVCEFEPEAEGSEEMCGGPSKRPCRDCGDQYCPNEKGKTAVLVSWF